jgi:molecular chaperone Hsp33
MSDRLIRGTFPQHQIRFAACQTAALCSDAIRRHQADWLSGWLLSEALTCAALLSVQLKDAERLTLRWLYPGPIGTILADIGGQGLVRGFPQRLRLMPEVTTLADAIGAGEGRVTATSTLGEKMGPTGIVPAPFGDVTRDLAHLMSLSFQVETALAVGLIVPPSEPIGLVSALGVLLQPLPGGDLEAFDAVRRAVERPDFRRWLESAPRAPEEALAHVGLGKPVTLAETRPAYRCRCSREKVERVLRMLERDELTDMITRDAGAEVNCHFCATAYRFSKTDLEGLLRQSQSGHA